MKKLYELKIDEEFRRLAPPLSEDEYKGLEKSILQDGCLAPIIVWDETILDGHARYEICRRHKVPFSIENLGFEDRDEAKLWVLRNHIARRNLNAYQRCVIALKMEELVRKDAQKRMKAGIRQRPSTDGPKRSGAGDTRTIIGNMAGVSGNTVDTVRYITRNADPVKDAGMLQKLRDGEMSIHAAFKTLKAREPAKCAAKPPMDGRTEHGAEKRRKGSHASIDGTAPSTGGDSSEIKLMAFADLLACHKSVLKAIVEVLKLKSEIENGTAGKHEAAARLGSISEMLESAVRR